MPNKHAILVGIRSVNPDAYSGWDGTKGCWGCELDIDNIEMVLVPLGYTIETLKTANATKDRILKALYAAANALEPNDTLVFYFSGHGGQQLDEGSDELDGHDETLVVYDGEIIDDQLNEIWLKFREGVRILMISDSCNSGTNYRPEDGNTTPSPIRPIDTNAGQAMRAQMIHMGGCRDSSGSVGYQSGGAFTTVLCNVWKEGKFSGSYRDFYNAICSGLDSGQQPQYNEYGPVTDFFRGGIPFSGVLVSRDSI
jgi:hypothetical protein